MAHVNDDAARNAARVEAELLARGSGGLFPADVDGEFVLPDYGGRSLLNVPATIGRLLGIDLPGIAGPLAEEYWQGLGPVRRVVLVLLDAFGYHYLRQTIAAAPDALWARLAAEGRLLPMTSVFPSTTNTSLASLLTGRGPAGHGLLGYELWLREFGVLAEMLALRPAYGTERESLADWGLEPERFVPVPALGTMLRGRGVRLTALVAKGHRHSALTRMLYRDAGRLIGYTDAAEMWERAHEALRRGGARRGLVFAYYGAIDAAAHEHGTAGGHWQEEVSRVTAALERHFLSRLSPQDRRDTLLIVLADHGFVDAPEELAHDVDADPVLRRHLLVPYGGESRASYVHCVGGPTDGERCALIRALGPGYAVVPTSGALAAGLFGPEPHHPEATARAGHLLAVARGLRYLDRRGKRARLRGRHGGLSAEEMLVPWLAVRLDG